MTRGRRFDLYRVSGTFLGHFEETSICELQKESQKSYFSFNYHRRQSNNQKKLLISKHKMFDKKKFQKSPLIQSIFSTIASIKIQMQKLFSMTLCIPFLLQFLLFISFRPVIKIHICLFYRQSKFLSSSNSFIYVVLLYCHYNVYIFLWRSRSNLPNFFHKLNKVFLFCLIRAENY